MFPRILEFLSPELFALLQLSRKDWIEICSNVQHTDEYHGKLNMMCQQFVIGSGENYLNFV